MSVPDRRNDMTLTELVDELEMAFPDEMAGFEARHGEAMQAVVEDDIETPDDVSDPDLQDALADLAEDLRARLRI